MIIRKETTIFSVVNADMLYKLLLIFCLLFASGCSRAASSDAVSYTAEDYADRIISDLSLSDMEEVKQRMIIGGIFDEKKDICTDASMYRSSVEGNNDCVGVFVSDDIDTCIGYLQTYLTDLKKESESVYPSEVFKISNAVIEHNDNMAVMIVCENIEDAKREAQALVNQ